MLTPVNQPNQNWAGLSQGMILQGRGLFVTSGHVAFDSTGQVIAGDFESQVVGVFENLKRTLEAAGLRFEHVARIVTFVCDYKPSMVDVFRRVRQHYINMDCPPVSVLIPVAALYDPQLKIEVEITAVVP